MFFEKLAIPDVLLCCPQLYEDNRGYFFESFNKKKFLKIIDADFDFVQDNQSKSNRNVIRGLHFQLQPKAQGKLVRVLSGSIFDVVLDIRLGSDFYGKWVSAELNDSNMRQIWAPPGFAHGFMVTSETAVISYKTTEYYAPELELSIPWNDPTLNIQWPKSSEIIISEKDAGGISFDDVTKILSGVCRT